MDPSSVSLAGAKKMKGVYRHAKLRTKTGCLPCRNRRKKCDEKSPACERCLQSNRECVWPTSEELLDRRFSSHHRSRHAPILVIEDRDNTPANASVETSLICRLSEAVAHRATSQSLEGILVRHFVNRYYRLQLLPDCRPEFSSGWISEIQRLMRGCKSVRYSVLSNAASNIHLIESNGQMQELALTYYSEALRGLSDSLGRAELLTNYNSVLMSMVLLCFHGCMGRGTYYDIPHHLNAATRVIALSLFKQTPTIRTPFDRIAVESVLYQVFLASTGLWSDEDVNRRLNFQPDLNFWDQAERLPSQPATMFPDQSTHLHSPVLGVPVSLLRLAITVKQMYQRAVSYDRDALNDIRSEITLWEDVVLRNEVTSSPQLSTHAIRESTSYLYILVTSLLSNQLSPPTTARATQPHPPPTPLPTHSSTWQIQLAISILQRHAADPKWASSYISVWPVYTLGFFLELTEHVQVARKDLRHRWEVTGFNQVARMCNDVEKVWRERGVLGAEERKVGMCWKGSYYMAVGR